MGHSPGRSVRPWRLLARLIACALVAHGHSMEHALPYWSNEQGRSLEKDKNFSSDLIYGADVVPSQAIQTIGRRSGENVRGGCP
jgi:hypothetical protein